jgi:gamma-glutamylcyclotransferase (GGCT)/AIG2-like uncharacterized protein YtfP
LFVYGTPLEADVQQAIIGRIVNSEPDSVSGFLRSRIRIGMKTYPILVEKQGHQVEGRVLEVSLEELAHIDRYETDAYRCVRVNTQRGINVWVYRQ